MLPNNLFLAKHIYLEQAGDHMLNNKASNLAFDINFQSTYLFNSKN